jgi:hypothetical protein
MRVTVTTADGERFEAGVVNLADGAFFLETERRLRFRTRLSVAFAELTVRGEVVLSARDPRGVLVAFTLEPAQRMFFAAIAEGVPTMPDASAPPRPSSAPARVVPVATPVRAEPTPAARRPPPRIPSIAARSPTSVTAATPSAAGAATTTGPASLGPHTSAATFTPSGTRGAAAVAAVAVPAPTLALVPATETPARVTTMRGLPPPPMLGLARPAAPASARAGKSEVEPTNSANDRTPQPPKASSTSPAPSVARATVPSPADLTAPPRGAIPHGASRTEPPPVASTASAPPANTVGSVTGPSAVPSRTTAAPPQGPSSPGAPSVPPAPRGPTLGDPRLPELRDAEIHFASGEDYRAQFRTNISFGGIVVRSPPMAVGSFHPLSLCVPGLAPMSLRARVGFNGDGTVGFMIDAFAVEKARFEALLEQLA